ncbi:nucleotidyltransferase domain-containing protein [Candidatus Pacearchaeota archaeon]|nr:nucleotidyltransferase domain-containing protein [Candidatus Pacearchaeota archaeon]
MKEEILNVIKETEDKHNVKVIWAIESGSRAWGFASEDSDYDIRCMHVGKLDCYLGLNAPPQQINIMKDNFDLESWDIKKFAELSIKSNPQIAEWLRSPIIYKESLVRKKFKEYFDEGCSLEFLRQHYIRMAKQNYHKYMGIGLGSSCKKYLYVLRGIACAEYITMENKLPPLPYKEVIQYLPEYARRFFEKCVFKKNTTEKAEIMADEKITKFIDKILSQPFDKSDVKFKNEDELNKYLIRTIKETGN